MFRIVSLTSICLILNFFPVAEIAAIVPAPPKVNAMSYLILDYHSGKMLASENIDERAEPASLTKVMTVYIVAGELASGNISLEDMVMVSEKAWRMQGSRMFIEVNKEVSVEDLLKGIIVQSGNDASVALAEFISGSEEVFVATMNQEAARLGMTSTNFMNSTGLPDSEHYTTVRDMAILSTALIRDYYEIYSWHSIREFTFNGIKQQNRNKMLWRDNDVDGIKTGHTDNAGYCLIASAKRGDMRLISVVMGSNGTKARTQATQSLMNFSFRFFETHKLYSAREVIASSKVWKGDIKEVGLGIVTDLYITIPKGKYKNLDASIELSSTIIAPVSEGDVRGNLRIVLEGEELINVPLIALRSVAEGSFLSKLQDDVRLLFE